MVNSPLIRSYLLGGVALGGYLRFPLFQMVSKFPSKIEWDRIPTDPVQEVAIELLDPQVFSGSVKRGSCWRFLGKL